jgi:hypothetical protein
MSCPTGNTDPDQGIKIGVADSVVERKNRNFLPSGTGTVINDGFGYCLGTGTVMKWNR